MEQRKLDWMRSDQNQDVRQIPNAAVTAVPTSHFHTPRHIVTLMPLRKGKKKHSSLITEWMRRTCWPKQRESNRPTAQREESNKSSETFVSAKGGDVNVA